MSTAYSHRLWEGKVYIREDVLQFERDQAKRDRQQLIEKNKQLVIAVASLHYHHKKAEPWCYKCQESFKGILT